MPMKIDVKHVAQLANLTMSDQELKKFETQLEEILKYVDKLKEVDTDGVEITSQVTGMQNITREDISKPSLTQEEATSGTNSKHNGMFEVKQILEES